jgi:adenosylcobinamide-phosphate synthase
MTLTLSLILDAIFGEPQAIWSKVPHPAVVMGRLIERADQRLNHGTNRRAKGIVLMILLNLGAAFFGLLIMALPGIWADVILGAILLAHRSLTEHVKAVATAVIDNLLEGRKSVGMIVGRDTSSMDEPAIARAAIESAAENFSDGVVAPAFWFALLGLPGLLVYKITNTADSMIGYKSPRYIDFGWAAARFDDLLNLVPARLTAILILLTSWAFGKWKTVVRDAQLHRSPNAGWPEAAMAVVLGIALSGPRSYDGELRDFPWVHPEGRKTIGPVEIDASVRVLWRAWVLLLAFSIVFWFV